MSVFVANGVPLPAASLLIAVGVQVLCQLFKVVAYSIRDRSLSPRYFVTAGGMPSAHAAFVSALTAAVGLRSGIDSEVFAVAFVFAVIVAYDAFRLRGHVQEHARRINRLQQRLDEVASAPRQAHGEARAHLDTPEHADTRRHMDTPAQAYTQTHMDTQGQGATPAQADTQAQVAGRSGEAADPGSGEPGCEPVSEMVGHSIAEIVVGIAFGVAGAVVASAVLV